MKRGRKASFLLLHAKPLPHKEALNAVQQIHHNGTGKTQRENVFKNHMAK